jgi:hypothetical protein
MRRFKFRPQPGFYVIHHILIARCGDVQDGVGLCAKLRNNAVTTAAFVLVNMVYPQNEHDDVNLLVMMEKYVTRRRDVESDG